MLWSPSSATAVVVLGVAAVVLMVGGTRFTRVVDRLADRTGLGEALHPRLWTEFAVLAVLVAATGYAVAVAGLTLIAESGLSSSFVGTAVTAVITSLPELVTVLVAVRIGALTLAVGNIVGGSSFDVLFVAVADVLFRGGSVYHAIDTGTTVVVALVVLLTAVLTAGLVRRQRKGIGFEGVVILGLYLLGLTITYNV